MGGQRRDPEHRVGDVLRLQRIGAAIERVIGGLVAASLLVGAILVVQPLGQTYDTAVGERRAISLEDGSTIELNTNSRVRVRLARGERRLWLEKGQAMFAVAPDKARPFLVTAGDTTVRALGTVSGT